MDLKNKYLHLESKQTPKEIPYDNFKEITPNTYPEQNQEWLNKKFYLTFRDLQVIDTVFESFDEKEIRQRVFTCIRWDKYIPSRCVFISEDFEYLIQFIITNAHPFSVDVHNDVDGYLYTARIMNAINEPVTAYPIQDIPLIGTVGYLRYGYIFNDNMLEDDANNTQAIVLSSTLHEPLQDILITLGNNTFKVYDGSEVWLKIDERFVPPSELRNIRREEKAVKYRQYYFRGRTPYGILENS